ncbi:ABC transporter permease [Bifidobacterium pullorum]|uniref:ABC transporter permease n=1 Tax=Bifidobacterium pullorum TaxID=78448 RepID=UPI00388D650A
MRKVLRLAWFERAHTFRTSRALVVLLVIVIAVCYCLQGFVVGAIQAHASNVEKHSNVSVIELSTIRPDARVLDGESLSEVSRLKHVVSVVPWMQHDLDLADEGDWPSPTVSPGSLWATTYFEPRLPKMIEGDRPASLQDDEILLPDSVPGGNLRHLYGKTIMFGYTHIDGKYQGSYRTIPLKVVGIYDNSVPDKDGENPSYVSENTMNALFDGNAPESYTFAYVKVDSGDNVPVVQKKLAAMGFGVAGAAGQQDVTGVLATLMNIGRFMLPIVLVCSLTFGSFLSVIWMKQRKRSLALLRCLGYTAGQLGTLALIQIVQLVVAAGIVGIVLGTGLSLLLAHAVDSGDLLNLTSLDSVVFDPVLALEMLGITGAGAVIGALPLSVKIAHSQPDALMRG